MNAFRTVARFAFVLAFVVVVLGAWVRLTDAGLGCPDWPGCYGQATVPAANEVGDANRAYPDRPLDADKAWREMIHRYAAGFLGIVVFGLALIAWRRRNEPGQPVKVPTALSVLIVFQALLGMWTVTLQLKPVIVMAHLLGGLAALSLLWWLVLATASRSHAAVNSGMRRLALIALTVLGVQIALGGWTSANYAALACPDFPGCQGAWWPDADFREGFVLWRGIGIDYEGGVLEHPARVAIHFVHRMGAVIATLVLVGVAIAAFRRGIRAAAVAILMALSAQVVVGITMVQSGLPLGLATAHNAVAALLLLGVVTLNFECWHSR